MFTVHAIPRLLALNPFQFDNYPVLHHGEVKRVDPEKLAAVIKSLADSGMPLFPSADGSTEKWVLDALGIPEPQNQDGPDHGV